MYAVIKTGGKQERVSEGQVIDVELLGRATDEEVEFDAVLLVDGDTVRATPAELSGAKVVGQVVGTSKGPKINAMTYKSKSNQRRRWGHRQHYTTVKIVKIAAS